MMTAVTAQDTALGRGLAILSKWGAGLHVRGGMLGGASAEAALLTCQDRYGVLFPADTDCGGTEVMRLRG